jgi:hypothetical protein
MRHGWLPVLLCLLPAGCPDAGTPADAGSDLTGEGLSFPDGLNPERPADLDGGGGQPCADPTYAGWRCLELTIDSPRHGATFAVEVRWNLPDQAPTSSCLWVTGGTGAGGFRGQPQSAALQDRLAQAAIRSVEVSFTDPPDAGGTTGGYFRAPRQGYVDAAWVYAEAVHELVGRGVAAGQWLTHLGSSNGTMIGAAALAHHGLGQQVRRYLFLAGPFAAELGPECTDESFYAFMGNITPGGPSMRALQDTWNGWTQQRFCEQGSATAVPSYDNRSLLGSAASRSYPKSSLTVLMGDLDEFGPWILASNENWHHLVDAGSARRYVFDGVGHDVLGAPAQQLQDTVFEHVSRPPLSEPGPAPTLIFSKTPDGPAETAFSGSDTLHGRVLNVGPDATACTEHDGNPGLCSRLSGWTQMPNADWSYDAATGRWSATIAPAGFPSGTYRSWWRDATTQQHSARVEFVLKQ